MTRRRGLDVLAEVAEDVIRAGVAIDRLRKGQNGAAVAVLVKALERETPRVVAAAMRRRRTRVRERTTGRFI